MSFTIATYNKTTLDQKIAFQARVLHNRASNKIGFFDVSDGSCFASCQVVYHQKLNNFLELKKLLVYSNIKITGTVQSAKNTSGWEIVADQIDILQIASANFPIQAKFHSLDYLRSLPHLRVNTKYFDAIFRVRSCLFVTLTNFFANQNFINIPGPILTTNDCEGAGETFTVSTPEDDFFVTDPKLTVSAQLHLESFAQHYRRVYSFIPIFRAEKSNTNRHLAEFWMLEPEVAGMDLTGIIQLAYAMLQTATKQILKTCQAELTFLSTYHKLDLVARCEQISQQELIMISYREAIVLITKQFATKNWSPQFGDDLSTEHEKWLCTHFNNKPVCVIGYPKTIKAFYMKQNPDQETVAAFDILIPDLGELIGGSAREEDVLKIKEALERLQIDAKPLQWYLSLREYGYLPSAGFGLGFERLVMWITGTNNIKDTIPYPRAYQSLLF